MQEQENDGKYAIEARLQMSNSLPNSAFETHPSLFGFHASDRVLGTATRTTRRCILPYHDLAIPGSNSKRSSTYIRVLLGMDGLCNLHPLKRQLHPWRDHHLTHQLLSHRAPIIPQSKRIMCNKRGLSTKYNSPTKLCGLTVSLNSTYFSSQALLRHSELGPWAVVSCFTC